MKKMLAACTAGVLFTMALGTTASASPLKNYDAGLTNLVLMNLTVLILVVP